MKEVEWNKNTLKVVKKFPKEVKNDLGYLIYRLQVGDILKMPYSRSMSSIAKGCFELRVKGTDGIYRAFYYTKIDEKILIFHAFQKKEQKTPLREVNEAKKNLKEMLDE